MNRTHDLTETYGTIVQRFPVGSGHELLVMADGCIRFAHWCDRHLRFPDSDLDLRIAPALQFGPQHPAGAGNGRSGPDLTGAGYVEGPADHAFTAFLAGLTPSRVLRERETAFSKVERKRKKFLTEPGAVKPVAGPVVGFTDRQLQIAMDVLARKGTK